MKKQEGKQREDQAAAAAAAADREEKEEEENMRIGREVGGQEMWETVVRRASEPRS